MPLQAILVMLPALLSRILEERKCFFPPTFIVNKLATRAVLCSSNRIENFAV